MTAPKVQVTIAAEDEASEIIRMVEAELKKLDQTARQAASSGNALGSATERSAGFFDRMRDGIRDVAKEANVSVKSLGDIEAAASRVGAAPDAVAFGLAHFNTQLRGLSSEAPEALAAFQAIGLGAEELGRLSLGDAVGRVATQIGKLPTEAQRGAASLALFGSEGRALVPVLRELEVGQTKVVQSSAGFGEMVVQLKQLAIAYGAIKIIDYVRDTITAADETGKLAQKLGIATEALSVFRFAAERNGQPVDHIERAMRNLSEALEGLRRGDQSAVAQFEAIGLSARDLEGLSLDQAFLKIANAMEKYRDGAGKINLATKLFGRTGIDLLPLLHQLSGEGFEEMRKKAEELGAVIDDDTARAAAEFNDNLSDLSSSLKGLTIDLVGGFLPALAKMVELLTKVVERAKDAAKYLPVIGPALDLLRSLNARQEQKELVSQATDATLNRLASGKPVKTDDKPDVKLPPDASLLRAAQNAQLAAERAGHARELSEFQSFARLAEQLEEARYAQGEKSLKDYYQTRIGIVREQTLAEQEAIQKDIDTLESTPLPKAATDADRKAREQEIADLRQRQNDVMIAGQIEANRLTEEERLAKQQLHDEVMGFEAQEAQARGNNLSAQLGGIEIQVRQYELALRKEGQLTSDEIQRRTEEFRDSLNNAAFANESIAQVNRVFNDLATERASIEDRAARGLISQKEAQQEILDLERSRIPELRQMAEAVRAFGEQLGNPEIVQSADAIVQRIDQMGRKIDEAAVASANFVDSIGQVAEQGLIDFLGSGIAQANGLRDAFIGVLQQVQQLAARLLVLQAFKGIKNLLGGADAEDSGAAKLTASSVALDGSAVALGGSGTLLLSAAAAITASAAALSAAAIAAGTSSGIADIANAAVASVPGLATGGLVMGPGTATSDSVFARLSRGEFVIRAAAVQQYGADFFAALNGMRQPALRGHDIPRFADGGLVTAGTPAGGEGGSDHRFLFGLEEGLVVKHMQSRAGKKVFLQLVRENANAIRSLVK
ncbi:MAG TPA: hypothetical protein VFK04_12985 [Gemmatimonadaceae bacterium]|nr:hypothetical protein [Gemmatimonadaceae bacterium]